MSESESNLASGHCLLTHRLRFFEAASYKMALSRPEPGPNASVEAFAQTGAEPSLDDSDDEDLRSAVGSGSDVYELHERNTGRGRHGSAIWDAEAAEDGDVDHPLVGERSRSPGSMASFQLYTPDEEQAVRRKFDRKLVLFVALLYMLSFVDRSSTTPLSLCDRQQCTNKTRYRQCSYSWYGRRSPV